MIASSINHYCTLLIDIFKECLKEKMKKYQINTILKIIAVLFGY